MGSQPLPGRFRPGPRSHCSPESTIESPHVPLVHAPEWQTAEPPMVLQGWLSLAVFGPIEHMLLAQVATLQVGTPVQSVAALAQLTWQSLVQPSMSFWLPSSQGSTPTAAMPSPHRTGTQLPAMQFLPDPQLLPACAG